MINIFTLHMEISTHALFYFLIYIYIFSYSFMVVLGLSCGMRSLGCSTWASL